MKSEPVEMKVDTKKLRELVKDGYLSCQTHPTHPLFIWNYTPRAQFDQYWTAETMMCRGLITREDGTVVARPFGKFFNIEQMSGALPVGEPFEVTRKMDGSLGILFWTDDGEPWIATRGSFMSEQAQHATKLYRDRYRFKHVAHRGYTYLFEIVYPANRIVVDYGDLDDLVLIAAIHTKTGLEVPLRMMHDLPFPVAQVYSGITDFEALRAEPKENEEGYVIRFEGSNLRVKLKYAEYVRLHRILTHVSERIIWECLMNGDGLDALLTNVPDEFYGWVQRVVQRFRTDFKMIEVAASARLDSALVVKTRKEQAEIIKRGLYPSITFAMLDGKDYKKAIWKLLRPAGVKPFKPDDDA